MYVSIPKEGGRVFNIDLYSIYYLQKILLTGECLEKQENTNIMNNTIEYDGK